MNLFVPVTQKAREGFVVPSDRRSPGAPKILPLPAPASAPSVTLAASLTANIPGFLVERPAGSGVWESLKVACSRGTLLPRASLVPFRRTFLKQSGPSGNSFGVALVLHWFAIVGLLYVPQYLPADTPRPLAYAAEQPDVLYYAVPVVHTEQQVPRIAPPGDAGRPGEGSKPEGTPARGSTASLGDLTVISKPLQPDNHHQTIIQPLSPPDMRITQDVKLPNVIMGNLSAPQAPLTFSAQDMPKPVQTRRQSTATSAPAIDGPSNALPTTASEPALAKPQLPIEDLKPIQQARGNTPGLVATPSLPDPTRGNLPITAGDPNIAKPQLPMGMQKPVQQARGNGPGAVATPNLPDSMRSNSLPTTAGDSAVAKPLVPMGMQKPVQQARGNGTQSSAASAPNFADPARADTTTLIAANEPTIAKPALPVTMQKPNQQGNRGNGQGSQGAPGAATASAAAPNVAEGAQARGISNFGSGGGVPTAPLSQIAGMQRPTQPGRVAGGSGSQGGQGGSAEAPDLAQGPRNTGAPNFNGTGNGSVAPPPEIPGLQRPVQQARGGTGAAGGQGAEGAPVLSNSNGLMIISTDPSPSGSQIAVPPGNRWGDFTIAPARGPGSPGGTTSSTATQAWTTGQNGSGGDRSVGVGAGGTGGGGGPTSASLGPISVKGTLPGAAGEPLLLTGSVAAEMVYPLPISVVSKLRANRMVVSAGSIGGGGLNVYGALACSKIYTIFLPMPGSSWTMQFCQKSAGAAPDKTQAQTKVIQMAAPIVPPDPDEDSRFDFRRVPVPVEKTQNKMIVLKGNLDEQGVVQNLQVFQGVQPEMDQAAQLAFSRWKFKPAMQSNKPVSVEILVGIPAQAAPPTATPSASKPEQSR